jgi:hypothetical protein
MKPVNNHYCELPRESRPRTKPPPAPADNPNARRGRNHARADRRQTGTTNAARTQPGLTELAPRVARGSSPRATYAHAPHHTSTVSPQPPAHSTQVSPASQFTPEDPDQPSHAHTHAQAMDKTTPHKVSSTQAITHDTRSCKHAQGVANHHTALPAPNAT